MSSAPKLVRSVSTRSIRKVEKPKPLKSNPLLLSASYSLDDLVTMINSASQCISLKNYNELSNITSALTPKLRTYGQRIEEAYKDQLDKAFVHFRNGCRDDEIDFSTRLNLLHLVELRAMSWHPCAAMNQYYVYRGSTVEEPNDGNVSPQLVVSQPLLNPGEVIKSSGKYSSPTKMPGKTYCKDEVVIRNADSGKVMGIRGRRVHMIEELSETVISFQRVSPGAKERLVQITGPDSDKIEFARQLMEDTIKRNASPVRELEKDATGSTSSLNSTASEESTAKFIGITANSEFQYTHTVHNEGRTLQLSSSNLEFVQESKLVLDNYFNSKTVPELVKPQVEEKNPTSENPASPPVVENVTKDDNSVILTNPSSKRASPSKSVVPAERENPPQTESEPNLLTEAPVKYRYMYDRQFLLECSSVGPSLGKPLDYLKIVQEFPMIARTASINFDAAGYLQKWKDMNVTTVANPMGDLDSE